MFSDLCTALQAMGFVTARDAEFTNLDDLTLTSGRAICAVPSAIRNGNVWPSGQSCWVQVGPDLSFLGLWSGRLYLTADAENLLSAVAWILREDHGTTGNVPSVIGENERYRYGLREAELVYLTPPNDKQHIDEVRSRPFDSRIDLQSFNRPLADAVRLDEWKGFDDTLFTGFSLGGASGFTRFDRDGLAIGHILPLVFYEGLRDTVDQVRLLHTIVKSTACSAFDGSWGSRIDLLDPYYDYPYVRERPDEPRDFGSSVR